MEWNSLHSDGCSAVSPYHYNLSEIFKLHLSPLGFTHSCVAEALHQSTTWSQASWQRHSLESRRGKLLRRACVESAAVMEQALVLEWALCDHPVQQRGLATFPWAKTHRMNKGLLVTQSASSCFSFSRTNKELLLSGRASDRSCACTCGCEQKVLMPQ
jgi:hypothetical protein